MSAPTRHAAFVATLAALTVVAPAGAAEPAQTREVGYADLDLTTDRGAATLNRRIARAAGAVCGTVDTRRLDELRAWQTCRDAAIADATPHVRSAIAAAHQGRTYADAGGIGVSRR